MRELFKKWWIAIVGFIAGLILISQKPKWVKEMEKGIKQRDGEIEKVKAERERLKKDADEIKQSLPDFKKVVKEQDEKIADAGHMDSPEPITDPQSIADFIRDRGRRK